VAAPPISPPRQVSDAVAPVPARGADAGPLPAEGRRADLLLIAVIALLVAACIPLARVFVGLDFLRPVAAGILLSVGLSWVSRRAGAGPFTALVVSALGFVLLVAIAFVPRTLMLGVIPTWESFGAARDLWLRGLELVRVRPAPTFAEDGLMLLTVTGVWWIAHLVEGLVFRLAAPLRAIGVALILWVVPLAVAPAAGTVWLWAVPLLVASAGLLLAFGGLDLARWGTWTAPSPQRRGTAARGGGRRNLLAFSGWPVAATAILLGVLLGGTLPGFGEPPWYEVRGVGGGTTLTMNPIVSIRSSLVSLSDQPVVQVRTPQPVYLRLTALDVYGENEEWTSSGIRGGQASGRLPFETETEFYREIAVDIEVQNLDSAVIIPAPYQPAGLDGPVTERFQFDRNRATLTLASGQGLDPGDRYTVTAAVPAPPADRLQAVPGGTAPPSLLSLPGGIPDEVMALAREIVAAAGAATPFEQAMAIQDELRSWTYSLDPPQGHSSSAMLSFISNRIGYCEQYAGTMAVMLRGLGIPARVAVGYSPGELIDPEAGLYQVRNANAHAWVEVLFDDLGWIAFEPTPRTDGNVLVPDAANLAPTATQAQELQAEQDPVDAPPEQQPADEIPNPERPPGQPDFPDQDLGGVGGASGGGAEDDAGSLRVLVIGVLLGLLALGVGGAFLTRSRGPSGTLVPAARVLHAVNRVHRVARGIGSPPQPAETDAEFLSRLTGGSPVSGALADAAGRARYARQVPADVAARADAAADEICATLLASKGPAGRAAVQGRAAAAEAGARVAGLLRSAAEPSDDQRSGARERLAHLVQRRSPRRKR
jgi:transglutaminase-like putative cysteine protease